MHIDKYKTEGDGWVYDGKIFNSPLDLLQGGILGFCCCGRPEDNLCYVAKVLHHISILESEMWEKKISYEEWKEQEKLIGNENSLYFVYYYLDKIELTEHGGSVPGWLTDKGHEFMEDVMELYPEEFKK